MATRRLYYDDSFLKEFAAKVLSCKPAAAATSLAPKVPAWEVILDQTAFYPTSGGQPYDVGRLGSGEVLEVCDRDEEIVHVVDRPIEAGEVKGCIDWERRFDHMQQHTGQHLLSAMFQKKFDLPTVSFHLGAEMCTIDVRGREPSEEILERAERAANEMIFEDRCVSVRYGTAEELLRLGVRKEVEREGVLRATEIEGVELQPCGGTHVRSTGQIGMILVWRCAKIRQDWRVEFVCGGRAGRTARHDFQLLREAAEKLKCAPEDLVSSAGRTVTERNANFKKIRTLLEQLAEAEAAIALQSVAAGADGLRIVLRAFEDVPAEYLGFFGTAIAKTEKTVALLGLAGGSDLLFAQHPSSGKDMNALLKLVFEKLAGKGGGMRDFARGRLAAASQLGNALTLAREKLSGA